MCSSSLPDRRDPGGEAVDPEQAGAGGDLPEEQNQRDGREKGPGRQDPEETWARIH